MRLVFIGQAFSRLLVLYLIFRYMLSFFVTDRLNCFLFFFKIWNSQALMSTLSHHCPLINKCILLPWCPSYCDLYSFDQNSLPWSCLLPLILHKLFNFLSHFMLLFIKLRLKLIKSSINSSLSCNWCLKNRWSIKNFLCLLNELISLRLLLWLWDLIVWT